MSRIKIARFSPGRVLFAMMFLAITIGTLFLALPAARTQNVSWLDLLFTATSATCACGLFTISLDAFTTFGHTVILILSQIGGLGLVTLTIFLTSFFIDFGFATQLMAGKLLELEGWKNIRSFIMFIIGLTVCAELIGAACFFVVLSRDLPIDRALFLSIFHAVASFCNTGITLFQGGISHYSTSYLMTFATVALMIFGSLGFVTWNEITQYIGSLGCSKKPFHFSLHSKIVLYGTASVIFTGFFTIICLEWNHALAAMSTPQALSQAFFQAVSCRSTGFMTANFFSFHIATYLFICVAAFIGGSPGSTSGGVKITNVALYLATIKAAISGKTTIEIRGRSIAKDQVYRALAVTSLGFVWIFLTICFLTLTETGANFLALAFEAVSAFCTLGLSLGATKSLSTCGKILIMATMVIGRIGSLTLILALKARKKQPAEFSYPEERVILS